MMAATPTVSPVAATPEAAWYERAGAIVVPRKARTGDYVRLGLAWVTTLAAVAFAVAGFVNPALLGFGDRPGVLYITGPALVLGALLQLYLVSSGIRRPIAAFMVGGVQIHGYYLKNEDITRIWIQSSPADGSAGLMVGTTREDAAPALVAVPPGVMSESELSRLFARVKQARAAVSHAAPAHE